MPIGHDKNFESNNMYYSFFGLRESAFSIAVNPRYLYMSDQHREALAHLLYGIQNGGFVMLTGEVGTGKTTLVRSLLEQLPENTDLAIILNPMASAPELLASICDELRVPHPFSASLKQLTDALNYYLLNNHAQGRKTVLLIDEAQLLQVPVLEQIRLLTNLETNTDKLLQIMLIGQPELKDLLATPQLRQLSQRITARFHLQALTLEETKGYIAHRLQIAGLENNPNPFPLEIVKLIHQHSEGIPRLINVIAERLLLGAYAQQKKIVDKTIFNQAIQEVTGHDPVAKSKNTKATKALFQGVVVIFLILLIAYFNKSEVLLGKSKITSAVTYSSSSVSSASISSRSSSVTVKEYVEYQMEKVAAETLLMSFSGETVFDVNSPCNIQLGQNYRCQKQQLSTWNQLAELNRPGLLTLVDDNKKAFYLFVTGLNADQLLVRNHQQEKILLWNDIAPLWNGEFTFAWNSPAGFDVDLQTGDQSPVITWVAEQFAMMDQQPEPLTRFLFTDNLQKRMLLFQSASGLDMTGKIDKPSLQKLNLLQGIDPQMRLLPDVGLNYSSSSVNVSSSVSSSGAN
jgi:general secretion pathway protein A